MATARRKLKVKVMGKAMRSVRPRVTEGFSSFAIFINRVYGNNAKSLRLKSEILILLKSWKDPPPNVLLNETQ